MVHPNPNKKLIEECTLFSIRQQIHCYSQHTRLSEDYSHRHSKGCFLRQITAFALASTFLFESLHCKKSYRFYRPQPGFHLSNTPWPGIKLNYSRPGRVWFVTFRLVAGKTIIFFYSVV